MLVLRSAWFPWSEVPRAAAGPGEQPGESDQQVEDAAAGQHPGAGARGSQPRARVPGQEGGAAPVTGEAAQLRPQQLRDQRRVRGLQGGLGVREPQPPGDGLQLPGEE